MTANDTIPPEPRQSVRRWRGRTPVAVVAALVVVLAPLAFLALAGDDDVDDRAQRRVSTDPLATVRAAVGQTVAAGSYEMETVGTTTTPAMPASANCRIAPERIPSNAPPGAVTCSGIPPRTFSNGSHAVVNFEPYAMVTNTHSGDYAGTTTYWNSTHVWQNPGARTPGSPGVLLTDYARTIVGALGRGPGAAVVIGLASPGGELNLEETAIASAEPAGTGTVDDVPVSYYDVTIDIAALANTPGLNDVQRETINSYLPMLLESGYKGTSERIAIDDDGYIREVRATTRFDDGSTSERHTLFFNFGCAPKVWMPDQVAGPVVPGGRCPPPTLTSSTSTASTTTAPASTTTSSATPSTSTTASTSMPTSTSTNPTTTSTGPPVGVAAPIRPRRRTAPHSGPSRRSPPGRDSAPSSGA